MTEKRRFEADERVLFYKEVDPLNREQLEVCSLMEREGFGTGIDPVELPGVIGYIAEHGQVWLQYASEDRNIVPTGVVEFIPLNAAMRFDPARIKTEGDISASPLAVIVQNQERVFAGARNFVGNDMDITYNHGIAMARRQRGYGTKLLKYALANMLSPGGTSVCCYIDIAKTNAENGQFEMAPNEDSYTVHLKEGFGVIGVVDPPVYDSSIAYCEFLRPRRLKRFEFGITEKRLPFNGPDAYQTMADVRDLTSKGFVGASYDKNMHEMRFRKLA